MSRILEPRASNNVVALIAGRQQNFASNNCTCSPVLGLAIWIFSLQCSTKNFHPTIRSHRAEGFAMLGLFVVSVHVNSRLSAVQGETTAALFYHSLFSRAPLPRRHKPNRQSCLTVSSRHARSALSPSEKYPSSPVRIFPRRESRARERGVRASYGRVPSFSLRSQCLPCVVRNTKRAIEKLKCS